MNVALLDPFEQNIPASISHTLTGRVQISLNFNSKGTLLAAGAVDGHLTIWDLQAKQVFKEFLGHCHLVVNSSFSGCDRYLLSCSLDWNCSIWNIKTGDRISLAFDCPLISCQFNPKDCNMIIILAKTGAVLLKRENDSDYIDFEESDFDGSEWNRIHLQLPELKRNQSILTISYAPDGLHIFVGTNKGFIFIYDNLGNLVSEQKVGAFTIKQIHFNHKGNEFIVNNDRIVRLYSLGSEFQTNLLMKFQDVVERSQWIECSFSHDEEYICGASGDGNRHDLYVWDKQTGVLAKMLQGPFEGLGDFTWHPNRPTIATVSNYSGSIYIWTNAPTQKYSSYDPSISD